MIYICVPAHDEGQTVGVVLWKVRQVMAESGRDYQILVADDGSTDQTADVLEPYTRVLPLTVMRSGARRGYAASLEMLLREAVHRSEYPRRDVVVVLQADFTEEPGHIPALLKRIESGADVVVSNAVPDRRMGWRERLRRVLMRTALRRFQFPEGVRDPLLGYHAYRVSSVRRALEERGNERLLRWEGRAANAALLRSVTPHARRVEAVDLTLHPERRQRASRSDGPTVLREVWSFSRNREAPGLIPVAGLAPTETRSARSRDHVVTAESLRRSGVSLPGDEDVRRRRSGGTRNGKGGRGVKDRRPQRPERTAAPAAASETGQTQRRKRRSPRAEPPAAGTVTEAAEAAGTDPAAGEAQEGRRRTRRGGRRRSRPKASAETPSVEQIGEEGTTEPAEPVSGEAGEEMGSKPRRRRGRRGGRRRSSRSPAEGMTGDAERSDVEAPGAEQA